MSFLQEEIAENFPPIDIDFGVIIIVALELKRIGYQVTEVFANGFSIFTKTKATREKLKNDIYRVGDALIHGDNERTKEKREKVEERVWAVKSMIIEETMTDIYGKKLEDLAYVWYDEDDNVRGFAETEKECIEQAKWQGCTKFRIMYNV